MRPGSVPAGGWRGLCSVCAGDVSETLGGVARKHPKRGRGWAYDDRGRLISCAGSGSPVAARYRRDDPPPDPSADPPPVAPVAPTVDVLRAEIATARADADRLRAEMWRAAHTARCLLDSQRALLDAHESSARAAEATAKATTHLIEAQRRMLNIVADGIPEYPNT